MKILTVVGARPQFIKAAVVSRAFRQHGAEHGIEEVMVHTGQHFDANMSEIFFSDMAIAAPRHQLDIHGGGHGAMTGRMLIALEPVMQAESPDFVLVYGDTNSTLAAALTAAKLQIPVAHVEAGIRSFNRAMPEELNRIITDELSTLLFAPTTTGRSRLEHEGVTGAVHLVGDVMYDAALLFAEKSIECVSPLAGSAIEPKGFVLATVHRQENTDEVSRLKGIVDALCEVNELFPVVLPLHPRTRRAMVQEGLMSRVMDTLTVIDPVGYLEMAGLERDARLILTDSGGVQKEAFFHRVPCVTLRDETEWVELVDAGVNRVVGADTRAIVAASRESVDLEIPDLDLYGDGDAGGAIVDVFVKHL